MSRDDFCKCIGDGGADAKEGCGWIPCGVFEDDFTKQPEKVMGTGRVGI